MALHHMLRAAAGNAGPSDPYFYDVTLLLTGDGTNGSQNNTFLDSSTNNFTITRNGNTTQGTFSPYGNMWSNYFDGSTAYTSVAANAAFNFGTGDFTVEFWAYSASTSRQVIIGNYSSSGATYGWAVQVNVNSTGDLFFGWGNATVSNPSGVWTANKWNHVAISRSGTTTKLFVNGVQAASVTDNTNYNNGNNLVIGRNADLAQTAFWVSGYVSNARIVKGTAVYTSNFTPSTTPLTAVSGTSLLTCQSNRFIDNSSNNFTLTVNGNTSVQRFSPFNPTAPYSASTIGGSGYFDGSGDYLSVPNNAAFSYGTGDFTIEFYLYLNATTQQIIWDQRPTAAAPTIYYYNNAIRYYANTADRIVGGSLNTGVWYHIALSRSGTSTRLFVNGVQSGSTYSDSTNYSTSTPLIAADAATGSFNNNVNGYISNLRVVKGTAVYTGTFTPPTSPLTAISNTSLLLNFTNAGIPDAAMMNDLETVGNAQVSTSVKKYGTGSLAFDGSGDYLSLPASQNFNFGTGNFTVEFWINRTTVTSYQTVLDINYGTAPNLLIQSDTTGLYVYMNGTSVVLGNLSLYPDATATWYHYALVRNGTTVTWYRNGTSIGSATYSGNVGNGTVNVYVGGSLGGGGYYLNGYIDDLRITKGYARYTANFTPPTAALPVY